MPQIIELKNGKCETLFNERETSPISLSNTWVMKRLITSVNS